MLQRERHYTLPQLCEIWGGPNPDPKKTHPFYHRLRRWFLDEPGSGTGKKHKSRLISESKAKAKYKEKMGTPVLKDDEDEDNGGRP